MRWLLTGCGDTFQAHVVSYADDFVILSRGRAAEALAWTKTVMTCFRSQALAFQLIANDHRAGIPSLTC